MLGWSEPALAPVTSCSSFRQLDGSPALRTRAICAVSPQDDWIRESCGCSRQRTASNSVVSCTTQDGNLGELHCCLPTCPSTAAGGGVSTVPTGFVNNLKVVDESGAILEGNGTIRGGTASALTPYLVLGGLLIAAAGGVGVWLYSKSKKRQELEQSLLRLTAEEDR